MVNRFEIAKQYKNLDALTFLHYLMSQDIVIARDEFVRFIKYLMDRIKTYAKYGLISNIKGLNPFSKGEGVRPDYYDYSRTDEYKMQIETFLDLGLDVHDLYMKPEYQDLYKELQEYFKEKDGRDIEGTELTKDGFFKIPGIDHLITVIPPQTMDEIRQFAKDDLALKAMNIDDAVIGKTATGKHILNMGNEVVKRFVLSRTLKDKGVDREEPERKSMGRPEGAENKKQVDKAADTSEKKSVEGRDARKPLPEKRAAKEQKKPRDRGMDI